MKLISLSILFLASLISCNAYKSGGRDQFESDSSRSDIRLYSCSKEAQKLKSSYSELYLSENLEVYKIHDQNNTYSVNYINEDRLVQSCVYQFKKNQDGYQFINKIIQQSEIL